MARNTQGILGAFRGRVGNVVGCQLGDTFYLRSLPQKRNGAFSIAERKNQMAFGQTQNWLVPLKPVVQQGFKNYYTTYGGYRAALAWNRKFALIGEYPNLFIDPAKAKLSGGTLPLSNTIRVERTEENQLHFHWDTALPEEASPYDQTLLVAYDIHGKQAVYTLTGNFRSAGEDRLSLPDNWSGRNVHVWLAFVAADRDRQSESVWLGEW
ncbi:MAG: hypothetical protein INR69_12640 [Mucilaginibacter polytrichastri]|nr:hypothetical protein [Mucilaginibacter polytrichastri]